jgi:hypothetical protein
VTTEKNQMTYVRYTIDAKHALHTFVKHGVVTSSPVSDVTSFFQSRDACIVDSEFKTGSKLETVRDMGKTLTVD